MANYQYTLNKPDILFSDVQFHQIVNEWIGFKNIKVKESTMERYKAVLKLYILPYFGTIPTDTLSTHHILDFVEVLFDKGLSAKTISDIINLLKNILNFASQNDIFTSICWKLISVKQNRKQIVVLSKPEEKRLCDYLKSKSGTRELGILIALCSGIRLGELCALRWEDINMKEKTIKVNKTMIRIPCNHDQFHSHTKIVVSTPKSQSSERVIPISDSLMSELEKFKRIDSEYVLSNSREKIVEPRNMQYYFKKVLKLCNVKEYNFHILRHTFATRCVENGFEIKCLSEILGHSSVKITLDRYVHSSMELKRNEMNKISFGGMDFVKEDTLR